MKWKWWAKAEKPEPERPGVANLKKALWYAERGLTQKARHAAKAAMLELKAEDRKSP